MKVLFAVNSENISESIIKKYQKEYKEILTYKNVYYFNAIIKELQKDKTYDRVVISEDLEPFANNNYDIIDKFLFEKLDSISDEATDLNGNDIPIILICTDRRSKSDSLLIKLFGIGVYSAIIGKDRSIDEVCRLISMPRTKKEAKQYYKIESDDVNYQAQNESDVSEVEIQNILMHYKRLGKNTERYVDSFNNIASQYTDSQLRVIAKFLPLNVKAVLESDSPKYQELMMSNSKGKTEKGNNAVVKMSRNTDDISFDAFANSKEDNTIFSNPVVIPSALNTKKPVRLTSKETRKLKDENKAEERVNIEPVKQGRGRPRKDTETETKKEFIDLEDLEKFEKIEEEENLEPVKRGRGRPKKQIEPERIELLEKKVEDEPIKRRRGRPKKQIEPEEEIEEKRPSYEEQEFEKTEESVNLFDLDEEEETETEANYEYSNYANEIKESKEIQDTQINNHYINETSRLISGEGKIVSFVGTSKNGTSFIVNNLALLLSTSGVRTAILDVTKNKNSYYIYTRNMEELRNRANNSIQGLTSGVSEGINVNKNLSVFTSVPGENVEIDWTRALDTLSKEYSIILVDCDFETEKNIFENSKEIYLVQSMDILTIQPMTAFLRELKTRDILNSEKLRIVINKYEKIRNISPKVIVGGMAYYNDPGMSFMTELFNKETVPYSIIPLDIEVYLRYLEGLITCEVSTNGYSKSFITALDELKNTVYPLVNKTKIKKNSKYKGFSNDMDETLNKMRKSY